MKNLAWSPIYPRVIRLFRIFDYHEWAAKDGKASVESPRRNIKRIKPVGYFIDILPFYKCEEVRACFKLNLRKRIFMLIDFIAKARHRLLRVGSCRFKTNQRCRSHELTESCKTDIVFCNERFIDRPWNIPTVTRIQ